MLAKMRPRAGTPGRETICFGKPIPQNSGDERLGIDLQ
jgi:hypothetical protein